MRPLLAAAAGAALAAASGVATPPSRSARYYSTPPLPPLRHTAPGWMAAYLDAGNVTLRQAAAGSGVFVGSMLDVNNLRNASDPTYAVVGAQQFALSTAENECKFPATQPQQNSFTLADCNYTATFTAHTLGGAFRGHNTVWGQSNPQWLTGGGFTPAQLSAIMAQHITTVVGAFGPQSFLCWDIVNEAVADSGSGTLKPAAPWYPALPNYVDLAFTAGGAVRSSSAPGIKLAYNDYGGEEVNTKSDKIYAMVQSMKQRGIPLDVVGLQMHVSVDDYPDPASVSANIARLGALGLDVHITEMDVRCTPPCGSDRLNLQAQIYGGILQACLNNTNCKSFETWGFTDRYTWLWSFNNPTHANVQPLPFDTNYQPKPAFFELVATFQAHAERAGQGASKRAGGGVRGSA